MLENLSSVRYEKRGARPVHAVYSAEGGAWPEVLAASHLVAGVVVLVDGGDEIERDARDEIDGAEAREDVVPAMRQQMG
jgi:hypothetical protein